MSPTTAPDHLPPPKPDLSFTKRPSSKLGIFLWRRRMWFEATFALSMLEPWEKIILLIIFNGLFLLVLTGIFRYMPAHLIFLRGRAMYYLWGREGDERLLWQWLGFGTGDDGYASINLLHKEL